MATIIKVSFDITSNKSAQWDAFCAAIRSLRDENNILVDETAIRMSIVGGEIAIAKAIIILNEFDAYPITYIGKV